MERIKFKSPNEVYNATVTFLGNRCVIEFEVEVPSDVDTSTFQLLTNQDKNVYGEYAGYSYKYKTLYNGFILSNIDETYIEPVEDNIVIAFPTINIQTEVVIETPSTLNDAQVLIYTKELKQNENRKTLETFLINNPLSWTDGEKYGITQDDQNEMIADKAAYELKQQLGDTTWKLEWHPVHGTCKEFTLADFISLLNAIVDFVYPYRRLQEQYKAQIYDCTTIEELNAINLVYEIPSTTTTA